MAAALRHVKLLGNIISVVLTAAAVASLLGVSLLPGVLGYKTYVVLSGSMEPAIHTGSVLVALPVAPETLKVGDVIVYNRSDVSESVTHRIIQIDQQNGLPKFITKGDANGAPDTWTVQYTSGTAGKIVLAIPFIGYAYHAIASPQGRIVFLVVPAVVLCIMWLAQIWRPKTAVDREERELPRAMTPAPSQPVAPAPAAGPAGASLPSSKADPPPLPLRQ